jgi:nicotinate dehydrogenase subunit B
MNTNDFLAANFRDIHSYEDFFASNRRDFLKRVGGGIVIFMAVNEALFGQEEAPRPRGGRPGLPSDFNAFLRIGEDGRVTCYTGKIEMGQGPITSLPQEVAEELDSPLDLVDIVMGDTDLCPWDQGTFGSMTTRMFGPALRAAAAEARGVLLELAADALKVPQAQLVAKDGVISDSQDAKNKITYGQLAKGQRITRHLSARAVLKQPAQFKVIGQSHVRHDGEAKVTGKAHYAADIRVPGMLYAKILRPPAHGATLKSVDVAPAKAVSGAQVIQEGSLVAVLHEFPDVAEAALGKIKAEWDTPAATYDDKTVFDHLISVAPQPGVVRGGRGGDLAEGEKISVKKFDSTYLNSYVAHSPMEPHAALCQIEGDKATVWASTQNPFGARDSIARAIGFPADKVRVITPFVGGGFGGKTDNQQAVEAARLAKAAGKPVQVMWTREEEFFYDNFRPAAVVKINSGVDAAGKMAFWDYDVYFAGERGAAQFYTVPNHRTASRGGGFGPSSAHPFGTGAWRAPGNNTNTFARESQIEIMAAGAGVDPVQFRLDNLSDPRMIRVLKAAADKFGWTSAKSPSRRGLGVACGIDAETYVAAIAEVAVDKDKGTVQVKRVVCAQDMGVIINPEGVKIQLEGCVTMGLGYALTEEVHFKGGQVLDTNYDTYELPRFSWVPQIESVLIANNENPSGGGGEPAIVLMGALVANAVYDATGARLFQLPMTPERVKAALQKI